MHTSNLHKLLHLNLFRVSFNYGIIDMIPNNLLHPIVFYTLISINNDSFWILRYE